MVLEFTDKELESLLICEATHNQQETILNTYFPVDLTRIITSFTQKHRINCHDILWDTQTYLHGQKVDMIFLHVPRLVVRVTPKMVVTRPADNRVVPRLYSPIERSRHGFQLTTKVRRDDQGFFIAIPDVSLSWGTRSQNYKPLLRIWRPLLVPRVLSSVYFRSLLLEQKGETFATNTSHWIAINLTQRAIPCLYIS